MNEALDRCPVEARPGTQALSFHVLRCLGAAQAVRAALVPRRPAAKVDALLLSTLALLWPGEAAAYPEHTLVDQAVTAAHQQVPRSAAFINAVLRRFLREREPLCAQVLRDPQARFNHPPWWIERLEADWPNHFEALLQADNLHPPMCLRVNLRRTTVRDYVDRLAMAGIDARPGPGACVTLVQPCPVGRLPGFAQGECSVQDPAAQLAAPLLLGPGLPRGASVLDACAAPGGKTAHLLECADLNVTAVDHDAARLAKVAQTLQRLGLQARMIHGDSAAPKDWWDGAPFDAILLDAPCSASGIVRRHPDVRWLRRATDIATLAATQQRLLENMWPLLRTGGRLLYATCSVFKTEGQDRIDAFLQRHSDGTIAREPASPGHLLPLADNGATPAHDAHSSPGDGFFYALLEKRTA